jgi:hypothetical protein
MGSATRQIGRNNSPRLLVTGQTLSGLLYALMALVFVACGAALFVGRLPEATVLSQAQSAGVAEDAAPTA